MEHYKECPKLKQGDDKKNEKSSNSASVAESSLDYDDGDMLSVSLGISDRLVDSWILDSASSYHTCLHKNWF